MSMVMFRRLVVASILLTGVLGASMPAAAQGGDNCPANVLLAQGRAGAVCRTMDNNTACYGNGQISAEFQPGVSRAAFDQPGDLADIGAIRQIAVTSSGENISDWSLATLLIQANLPDTQQRNIAIMLFGDATITNQVPPLPALTATATGGLNIRGAPEIDGELLLRLGVRDTVIANGRTDDGDWLRVLTPGADRLGWVSTAVITTDRDPSILDVVDTDTPFNRPFQILTLSTSSDDAPCAGAPESGVIIQTPNTFSEVALTINGIAFQIAATVFIQAGPGDGMIVNVLDGELEVHAGQTARYAPAGSRLIIPLGDDLLAADAPSPPEPYLTDELAALPLNNLDYRFVLPEALAQEAIDELVTAHFALPATPTSPDPDLAANRCVYTTRYDTSLRAGPGGYYEVVNEISSNRRIYPVLAITDADGVTWWQLRNSNWLRAAAVRSEGECEDIPITTIIPAPPYNSLSLETCMTGNGPLRAGQVVTIDFVPPGWETYADAIAATRIDPGQLTINGRRYNVYASEPVRIAADRYIRTFSTSWTATEGMYRIEAERLSYVAICNVSVPVGP